MKATLSEATTKKRAAAAGAAVLLGCGLLMAGGWLLGSAPRAADDPEDGITIYQTWFGDSSQVVFDHNLHEQIGPCGQCHHLERCAFCHQESGAGLYVSDSKIALHRACLTCHVQDPRGENCGECHTGVAAVPPMTGVAVSPRLPERSAAEEEALLAMTPDSYAAERRPRPEEMAGLEPEDVRVYLTEVDGLTTVYFKHAAHAEERGISCGACHHFETCGRCHDRFSQRIETSNAEDAFHATCITCHAEEGGPVDCDECHRQPRP